MQEMDAAPEAYLRWVAEAAGSSDSAIGKNQRPQQGNILAGDCCLFPIIPTLFLFLGKNEKQT